MAKTSATAAPSTTRQSSERSTSSTGPVFSCRHRALKAAVWKNDSESGPFYNVTLTRSWKDGETWKESTSFGYDDLLIVAELLRTCYGFMSREVAHQAESSR
jgi:hypothetical protein